MRRDIEPTNNGSEQALRPSVIHRKATSGFRSGWGAKAYAYIRSVAATAAFHGRSAVTAIRASLVGRAVLDTG